jgi:hypothetical protein
MPFMWSGLSTTASIRTGDKAHGATESEVQLSALPLTKDIDAQHFLLDFNPNLLQQI